jgi:hypothetical protein
MNRMPTIYNMCREGYTPSWCAFARNPQEVKKYGPYSLMWKIEKPAVSHSFSYYNHAKISTFVKKDPESNWQQVTDNYWITKEYFQKVLGKQDTEELFTLLDKEKESVMREHRKQKEKERKEKLAKEAEENNISIDELRKIKRQKREQKIKHNKNKKFAKVVKNDFEARRQLTPALRELIETAQRFENMLKNPDLFIKAPHYIYKKQNIKEAVRFINIWIGETIVATEKENKKNSSK